jgi:hypothetical protein
MIAVSAVAVNAPTFGQFGVTLVSLAFEASATSKLSVKLDSSKTLWAIDDLTLLGGSSALSPLG